MKTVKNFNDNDYLLGPTMDAPTKAKQGFIILNGIASLNDVKKTTINGKEYLCVSRSDCGKVDKK